MTFLIASPGSRGSSGFALGCFRSASSLLLSLALGALAGCAEAAPGPQRDASPGWVIPDDTTPDASSDEPAEEDPPPYDWGDGDGGAGNYGNTTGDGGSTTTPPSNAPPKTPTISDFLCGVFGGSQCGDAGAAPAPADAGAATGDAGAECSNKTCGSIFDCKLNYAQSCGFTACESGICK